MASKSVIGDLYRCWERQVHEVLSRPISERDLPPDVDIEGIDGS